MSLIEYLKNHIIQHGPVPVAEYMALALAHPEYGYYMRGDPLGVAGDFTTAPEISQMFGEVLAAYFVHQWMKIGQPEHFIFLECGPGRGTLMADMMRTGSVFPGFAEAAQVHLLETSPVLRDKQASMLADYEPVWHEDLSEVPRDMPILAVANEFLDALPVEQYEMGVDGWCARKVGYEDDGEGFWIAMDGEGAVTPAFDTALAEQRAKIGEIAEVSPARSGFVRAMCEKLKAAGGSALFIDYGHSKSGFGDTLQAIKDHEYCDVLAHMGEADLTAHVDFEALKNVAERAGVDVSGPMEQGEFLRVMGMFERAETLKEAATAKQRTEIEVALRRLTHPDEMGRLFKVMGLSYGG